jgi:hypothetical protein
MVAATILDAVENVRRIVFTADGINSAYTNIPENAPTGLKLPAALCRIDPERRGQIDLGNEEVWRHPIQIDVLVDRAGDIANELATVQPFIVAVVAALRGNASILGIGALVASAEYRIGQLALWQEVYWGASLFISVEEMIDAVNMIVP